MLINDSVNIFMVWLICKKLPKRYAEWAAVEILDGDLNAESKTFFRQKIFLALVKSYSLGDRLLAAEYRRAVNKLTILYMKSN